MKRYKFTILLVVIVIVAAWLAVRAGNNCKDRGGHILIIGKTTICTGGK